MLKNIERVIDTAIVGLNAGATTLAVMAETSMRHYLPHAVGEHASNLLMAPLAGLLISAIEYPEFFKEIPGTLGTYLEEHKEYAKPILELGSIIFLSLVNIISEMNTHAVPSEKFADCAFGVAGVMIGAAAAKRFIPRIFHPTE